MLTFEEKLAIIESFPELKRHDVSLGRVNFHYEESVMDKKIVVYRLHPNGNGFVYAELIDDDYDVDSKGMVNIRDFSEEELRKVIKQSIDSLSEQEPFEETWINKENQTLKLVHDFDLWNVYAGDMLDATHTTYEAAADYLQQEGFRRLEK
ncbi:hypothetical protein GMD78_05250 [Ornithinibacillus sp. L9]|uniref:Uncharacterized protein n=1 Tax=Ornithinibacillus caprae TaxID=2678566 RepID=A0A6N8FIE5_9BACI|nr:hypothetical protein [Ornithinibacillus caprae]MUK87807.1 hypothetical protein [Ornithinibacillus caprae]